MTQQANENQHLHCPTFNSVVYDAAKKGDVDGLMTALASHGHLIDTPNPRKLRRTPLYAAAQRGNVEMIEKLVELGSTAIDVPNEFGWTPIRVAARSGFVDVIETLIRLGSTAIDTLDNFGRTPLFAAAFDGHVTAIGTLVRLGSKAIDTPDKQDWTPLHSAASNGHVSVIETLVRLGSRALDTPNADGCTPMYSAAMNGHANAIETLVRLGSNAIDTPNTHDWTPMFAAAWNGHANVIETLVRLGSRALDRTNSSDWNPLAEAIGQNKQELILCLLRAGADVGLCLNSTTRAVLLPVCSQSVIPELLLVRFFDRSSQILSFKGTNLTNEQAAKLPLSSWKSVAGLDLRGNPNLTEIPMSLAVLDPKVTQAIFFDAPSSKWNVLEAHIVNRDDHRAIIEHAKLKAEGGPVSINERKLIAVGFAAVGKTTLVRRLKDENYSHPLSTDGVDMGELILSAKGGEPMRVVVWDFAGQPLYRQTHLLFLRTAGVCLLLFKLTDDVKTSVEQLRYWCDTLRSFSAGSQSQAVLVGTHLDRISNRKQAEQRAAEVWFRLHEFLPFFGPPVLVSCADGRENKHTIDALRTTILQMAQSMNVKAPACVEVARQALVLVALRPIPLLTREDACKILIEHCTNPDNNTRPDCIRLTKDEALQERCLRALDMLGSIIVVEERGEIAYVIANPQWVALLLATVVTTRHTWITHGRVSFATLSSQVWRGSQRFPVEIHDVLVNILEKLKIMFALNKRRHDEPCLSSHEFFVPCSLSDQRPRIQFAPDTLSNASVDVTRLCRIFKLAKLHNSPSRSVPIGLLPTVIAQMMSFPQTKMLEVWQQGGVFRVKSGSKFAVVSVCKSSSDVIEITVQSQHSQLGAEWIRNVSTMVENQFVEVYHTDFEVRVPCLDEDGRCFLQLNDLRASIVQQRLETACHPSSVHKSRVDVVAPDLLFADLGYEHFVHRWSSVELLSVLGQGAFGKVMRGKLLSPSTSSSPSSSEFIAAKLLQQKHNNKGHTAIAMYQEFQHEAYLMSLLRHPNIVRFVGVCFPADQPQFEHENSPALLMEVVDGGTLYYSLTDSVGMLQVCKLASKIMESIGAYNVAMSMHKSNPTRNPQPEPLSGLDEICEGALGRINRVFEQRIFSRITASALAIPEVPAPFDMLRELHQELKAQLVTFYQGPVTRELHLETDRFIDKIKDAALQTNQMLVPIEWPLRLKLAADVARGLLHMHSLAPPLVHRDFKSPNVFLMRRLDTIDLALFDWSQPLAKVGDFGLSIRMLGTTELKVGDKHILSHINPMWAAPEVMARQMYSTEADVYAMGIMLWELLTRKMPFAEVHLEYLGAHVVAGGRPVLSAGLLNDGDVECSSIFD